MTLRGKTLLIIGLTLAGLAAICHATSHAMLLGGFLTVRSGVSVEEPPRSGMSNL